MLALALAGIALLVRSRRRHRPAQTVVAAGVLLIGLLGAAMVTATTARADVDLVAPGDPGADAAYASCIANINSYDPNFLGGFGSIDLTVTPTSGDTFTDLYSGEGPRALELRSRSHFNGDVDGSDADPCAALFHELNHARNWADDARDEGHCAATNGIPYEEVNATEAENGYRAANGLPPRTTYGDRSLPPSLVHCTFLASSLPRSPVIRT